MLLHVVTPDAWEGDWDDGKNTLFPEGQKEGIGSRKHVRVPHYKSREM
jgi:hypothetical protein